MKGLGQRYVQYVNRTDHRTGTLFDGRCSSVIEAGLDQDSGHLGSPDA